MGLARQTLMSSVCLVLVIHFLGGAVCQSPEWIVCDGGPCDCNESGRQVTCEDISILAIQIGQYFPSDTVRLDLRNNEMEDFPTDFFILENLGRLSALKLHDNPLRSLTKDSFAGIPFLATLEITGGSFISLPPDLLLNVRYLQVFYLSDNPFIQSLPDSLFVGTSMYEIRLTRNPSLHHIPERLFMCTNDNLRIIQMAYNNLTSDGIPRNFLDRSSTVTQILIEYEPEITHVKASWFQGITGNDVSLVITGCPKLQYIEEGAFDGFSNISTIFLATNDIGDAGIPQDVFVNVAPVIVNLRANPRLSEYPAACKHEGVSCNLPPRVLS